MGVLLQWLEFVGDLQKKSWIVNPDLCPRCFIPEFCSVIVKQGSTIGEGLINRNTTQPGSAIFGGERKIVFGSCGLNTPKLQIALPKSTKGGILVIRVIC